MKKHNSGNLLPKNDVIFKNLFSKVGNEDMLKELLEEIIKVKIYDIQVEKEVELSQMKVGEKYYSDTVTVDSECRSYELVEGLTYHFIELPKFRKMVKCPATKLQQWLAFIDYTDKETVKMAMEKNELVKKAHKDYEYLTGDAALRRLQELREKAIWDENSAYATGLERGEKKGTAIGMAMGQAIGEARGEARGKAQGKKQGIIEGKIETAKAMMQNKIKREIVAKCTGLSDKELNKIAQSLLKPIS